MNLDDEIRDGYLVSSEMKKVWNVQMDLLKHLLDVCNRHNLKIWAEGGTLLGTIRHKGYIPWDDDIDMMMMRDDYDKLISVANEEFKHPYFLQCVETEENYIRGHAQLRNSNTTALLPNDIWQTFNQGIFIDIFVFDYLPSKEEVRNKCIKNLEKKRNVLYSRYYGCLLSKSFLGHIVSLFDIKREGGTRAYYKRMEKDFFEFTNRTEKEIGSVLWTTEKYQKYVRNIEWYRDTIYMPFENMYMPVPIDFNAILTRQYGDYLKPVKARSYHGDVIFNVDKPYTESLTEYRKHANIKQIVKKLFSIKNH